jgi:hypothetical protein
MRTCLSLAVGLTVFLTIMGPSEAGASEVGDAIVHSAEEILSLAFANRYDCDLRAEIELRMSDRSGSERRRLVKTVVKRIDGRLHSIGRLVSPQYLKGMTIMSIENRDRSDDSFVYLPSLGRVRRITTAQRADSFLGSDLTYEAHFWFGHIHGRTLHTTTWISWSPSVTRRSSRSATSNGEARRLRD